MRFTITSAEQDRGCDCDSRRCSAHAQPVAPSQRVSCALVPDSLSHVDLGKHTRRGSHQQDRMRTLQRGAFQRAWIS